ncbi:hypothetical protein VP01_288g1 [Puccinia sorghi]|uniref:Uncharacterized protein n=1 Tax=Puccinia sorghi TaxID=27349 RepID=A0A0L6V1L2_9BASI|nr:hypothetical protein VP01_288g1 [Puccinia sorghi]
MPNTAMTYTASKLRLPKSIKKDCDTMIQHIEELCRECLSVEPKTDPTITRPSTSTPRLRTYKPKRKITQPTSITSCISTSYSSHSHGNEAQNDDENTNRMKIDPTPSSQHNDTFSTSHKLDRQSVASNNPPSETANNYQTFQASATNPTNEQTSCHHSTHLANVINPESSPNKPPLPHHSIRLIESVNKKMKTKNNPKAENESIQPNQSTTIPNHPSHDSTTDQPAPPIHSDPERYPQKTSQSLPANNFLRSLQDWPTLFVRVESQSPSGIKAATHLNTFSSFVWIHQKIFVHLPRPSSITLLSSIMIIGPRKLLNQTFMLYSGKQFLAYSDHEFWWAPQVINLDLAKKEVSATKPILPLHQRSPHIDSSLFRVLGSVINPPPSQANIQWARAVAISILMNPMKPEQPQQSNPIPTPLTDT